MNQKKNFGTLSKDLLSSNALENVIGLYKIAMMIPKWFFFRFVSIKNETVVKSGRTTELRELLLECVAQFFFFPSHTPLMTMTT